MTHFPNYDAEEVRNKLAEFNQSSSWLIENSALNRDDILLHVSNSYTALNVPEAQLDMVRPGGVLYGDLPTNPEYPSIVSFKTRVASLHNVPANSTVVTIVVLSLNVTVYWQTCRSDIQMGIQGKWVIVLTSLLMVSVRL